MNNTRLLAGIFIGVFIAILCLWLLGGPHQEKSYVIIEDNQIEVQVAETIDEQVKGLSGKVSLGLDEGMLFIYEVQGFRNFWMKDMNFPIDIIWIGSEQTVVDITRDLSPDTYPESFTSTEPAQYVLEVNSGYAQNNGINIGDYAIINLNR